MKLIIVLIITLMMNDCGDKKDTTDALNSNPIVVNKDDVQSFNNTQEQRIIIEYSAITRGSLKQVKINNNQVSVKKSHSEPVEEFDCKQEEWARFMDLLNDVSLADLSKLDAPTKAHQYDGALAATLTITKDEEIYSTSTFDHGNPPLEIKALVDYILSVSKVE